MSEDIRIQLALDNSEEYIARLAAMPDERLAKKLNMIHLQSVIAEEKRMTESLELLGIWRTQVIAARILKAENNIPDAPNEIELAISDIKTVVAKTEERQEIFTESFNEKTRKPKIKEHNQNQTSLF